MYHRRFTLLARWTIHALKAPKGKEKTIHEGDHIVFWLRDQVLVRLWVHVLDHWEKKEILFVYFYNCTLCRRWFRHTRCFCPTCIALAPLHVLKFSGYVGKLVIKNKKTRIKYRWRIYKKINNNLLNNQL